MLLNRANRVLGLYELSTGGVAAPKLIFVATLKSCASAIVLCHNHPSGNLSPSSADIQLSKKLKEGGSLLGHIINTSEGVLLLRRFVLSVDYFRKKQCKGFPYSRGRRENYIRSAGGYTGKEDSSGKPLASWA
nr:JAB domain-containing protein [Rufibacter quisquiliarum]